MLIAAAAVPDTYSHLGRFIYDCVTLLECCKREENACTKERYPFKLCVLFHEQMKHVLFQKDFSCLDISTVMSSANAECGPEYPRLQQTQVKP
jgi:hypothetical protein